MIQVGIFVPPPMPPSCLILPNGTGENTERGDAQEAPSPISGSPT
jgi:hypothetical protein